MSTKGQDPPLTVLTNKEGERKIDVRKIYFFLCRISAIVGKRSDLRKIIKIKINKEKTIELAPINQKVCCLENIKDF